MATFAERIVGAAKLDVGTYEEIEQDAGATGQASAVVVLSSVAAGIGSLRDAGLVGLAVGSVGALVGWLVWAFVTYFVGTRMLSGPRTQADLGQLLRTLGFSSAPGLIQVLGVVPGLGRIVGPVAGLWMLASMVVAVRQALDYDSTVRALAVCVIGFLCYMATLFLVVTLVLGLLGWPRMA
jgi:hypothetical protein